MTCPLPFALLVLACGLGRAAAGGLQFQANLFAPGMILQRGTGTKVFGTGATAGATVTVHLEGEDCSTHCHQKVLAEGTATAKADGTWVASLDAISARSTATLTASDGKDTLSIEDVAVGDVLLCGGQSNMGFGMCGARSKTQTPQQALDALVETPIRFYFQSGSGPNGGTGTHCKTSSNESSTTVPFKWFTGNATNAGGCSAVCLLTATRLYTSMKGKVPVGAVESCVGGTPVADWTPPSGVLWSAHMVPLLPMTFKAALWDQGEADAKRTNSTWYTHEFPNMITGWRKNFETADLPFVYVELCTEYGAIEPKESDFWMAQRSALTLPATGYATTTDIERALHPPDKQDVADRLLRSVQRLAYGLPVVSRGPELVASSFAGGKLELTFSNTTLAAGPGIFVAGKACGAGADGAFLAKRPSPVPLKYEIDQAKVTVECEAGDTVYVNADVADCFLYNSANKLPAPPIEIPCKAPAPQ